MKRLARTLAFLSLGLSSLPLFHLKPMVGPVLAMLLAPLKLLAGSLAFLAAALGALAVLLGLVSKTPLALLAGGAGTALSARYVRRVTAPHDGFEQAFGAGWQSRMPPKLVSRMLRWRWACHLPSMPEPRWARDVIFWTLPPSTLLTCAGRTGGSDGRGTRHLLCDIWQPPQGIPRSGLAFMYFHGGSWHEFDKDTLTRPFFQRLAAQGHVVMDVAYRLYPEVDMCDMVGDAKRAVAWTKANAHRYGVNPERVVVAGGSAGGHLALLTAYTPGHPALTPNDLKDVNTSVRAAVAFYPPVDLRAYLAYNDYRTIKLGLLELTSPQVVVPGLMGGTPDKVPERYDLLSPINHVSLGCPPTLLLQAEHDHVVPVEPVRALHRELVAAGVPAVYVEFPATEHAFDLVLPQVSPSAQATLYDVERFLALMV